MDDAPLVEVSIRSATGDDYPGFARLFPELGVDDPVPAPEVWTAYVPFSLVAVEGDRVLGFCYTQEYADTGYVRNIAVAPEARRRGIGRALMEASARHLRAAGKRRWRLNVEPRNTAALALYEGLGLKTSYRSRAVRLPWACVPALPASLAAVSELSPERDGEVESRFELPRGQLSSARAIDRQILVAKDHTGAWLGLAVFAPAFPGAFPFRTRASEAVRPLLEAMHTQAADHPHINLVIDEDEPLLRQLFAAGAETRGDFLHLVGTL